VSALLLDASVWLAALDEEDRFHLSADRIVRSAAEGAALGALDLTLYEVANVATVRWRSPVDAERVVELVTLCCPDRLVRCDPELLTGAAAIANDRQLTVYDAAYVAAARVLGWTLVSADLADLVRPGLAIAPDAVV
jgi:predicted nucleic acid-binding protein